MRTHNKIHYGYVIVFCCCLIMAVNVSLMMGCVGIFYEPVSRSLGVTVGTFGLYISIVHFPLMFATGVGANGNRSLGTGTVGGLIVGTVALLLFVPTLFIILQWLQERLHFMKQKKQ